MSDGPFKNPKLTKRWRQFADAVHNAAFGTTECCILASDALVQEILSTNGKSVLAHLVAYASQNQLDLDPFASVEAIFNSHCKEPFVDILQKEVAFRVSEQTEPSDAIKQGLEAALREYICEVNNRIEEECIHARESGKMRQDQFLSTVNQARTIFEVLPKSELCAALLSCDKGAFKVSKKIGLDEGPSL